MTLQTAEIKQFNFTLEQITSLMAKQDELNSYIHPDWKTQGFSWCTAIIDECMEIKGHLGWKWWKKDYNVGVTEANKSQIKLEVIDILHFVLSLDCEEQILPEIVLGYINENLQVVTVSLATEYCLEDAALGNIGMLAWARLAHAVGLTEQEVMETYIQKYVLNKFRQDHGYKDGSYIKVWRFTDHNPPEGSFGICYIDLEDNQVLSEIVHELGSDGDDITSEHLLYTHLELRYNARLNK